MQESEEKAFIETVVNVNRCSKVVKGGRRFSFSALVVCGDEIGSVGYGYGKANEVAEAVNKAIKEAKKNLVKINLLEDTIPHETSFKYRASKIFLFPASKGTGVIADHAVRAVVEAAGIKNILTKIRGSTNPLNVVKATMNALLKLKDKKETEELRGVKL